MFNLSVFHGSSRPINHFIKFGFVFSLIALPLLFASAQLGVKQDIVNRSDFRKFDFQTCQAKKFSRPELIKCWEEAVKNTVERQGVEQALSLVAYGFNSNVPHFQSICHDLTHAIGSSAYQKFKEHGLYKLGPNASYCGYGFYHGLAEKLLNSSKGTEEAEQLCRQLDQVDGSELRGNCYHGIGHGAGNIHDPSLYGNASGMISQGNDICKKVSSSENDFRTCYSGVLMSLSFSFRGGEYGLNVDASKPFSLCDHQPKEYLQLCYGSLFNVLTLITDGDYPKAFTLAQKIDKDILAEDVVKNLSGAWANKENFKSGDSSLVIATCHSLRVNLQNNCLNGFVGGLLQSASPGEELKTTSNYCFSELMSPSEKRSCLSYANKLILRLYSTDKIAELCRKTNPQLVKICSS